VLSLRAMTPPHRPDHTSQLVTLDILRAAAAIFVVLEHSRGLAFLTFTKLPPEQQTLLVKFAYLTARLGQEAVMLFFVLSGYLVGGQVIRRVRRGTFDPRDFTIDRATRILLPLVPAALFAGLVGTLAKGAPFDAVQVAGNALGFNGILVRTLAFDLPLWSLPFEIWFYVIAGAGATICAGRGGLIALGAVLAATVVFCRLDAALIMIWMLGALVSAIELRRWRGGVAMVGLVVVILGSAAIQSARPSHAGIHDGTLTVDVARSIFASGVTMMLPWLASPGINRILAQRTTLARVAAFLAGMSYSLYLFHYPALNILDRWFSPAPVSAAAFATSIGALAILLAFAAAMYWLFERNTDRVRRHIKAWVARRDAHGASNAPDDASPAPAHGAPPAAESPR
jgi:peptidoglycan/LPS O-acetylase OafA/YrhL